MALVRVNGKKSRQEEDLLQREGAGEKIDWDRYAIIINKNLKDHE